MTMTDHDDLNEPDIDPTDLFERHKASGEPLAEDEVTLLHDARVAPRSDFSMRGGGLFWHDPSFPDPDANDEPAELIQPQVITTAEEFRTWLTARVEEWCARHGLSPHGAGEDLGDLLEDLDRGGGLGATGLRLVVDPLGQRLYWVGPGHAWIASNRLALSIEGEPVWPDPLAHLRLDHSAADLLAEADRLRARADEIVALTGTERDCGGTEQRP